MTNRLNVLIYRVLRHVVPLFGEWPKASRCGEGVTCRRCFVGDSGYSCVGRDNFFSEGNDEGGRIDLRVGVGGCVYGTLAR